MLLFGILLHALVDYALMRGMHIDHDQAIAVFRQNVNSLQLGERKTQWWYLLCSAH